MIRQLVGSIKLLNKQRKPRCQLAGGVPGNMLSKCLVVAAFCLIFPSVGFSLGLSGITLKSALDQKLDASIEILSVSDQELKEITIKLASLAVYERMGIDRSIQVEQLKFEIIKSEAGKNLIHITTPRTISEPFLNFLVEINWASGRLLREFTVLLDPPVFLEKAPPALVAKPETSLPSTLSTPKGVSDVESTFTAAVDTLTPVDETSGDEEILAESSSRSLSEPLSKVTAEPVSASTNASLVYDSVKQNEFLWQIANSMRPEDVSVEQMMVALKNQNPAAFFGDNVSMLKAGAVLRIKDTSSLYDVTTRQAILEIENQHQEWLAYRQERNAKRAAVAAESTDLIPLGSESKANALASNSATSSSVNVSNQPLLELVAAIDEKDSENQSSNAVLEAAEEKVNELNIELVMATEEIEARRHENEDLVSRLNSLEEQMSAMQSLVQLKDAELAKLRGEEIAIVDNDSAFKPLTVAVPELQNAEANSSNVTKVISKKEVQKQQLWQDPITIGAVVFALLLIALAVVLIRRKSAKQENEEFQAANKDYAASEEALDELFPDDTTNAQHSFIARDVIAKDKSDNEKVRHQFDTDFNDGNDGLGPMTDIDFENTLFPETTEDLLDPLSEADVYLTYEKFEKAEKLLITAIQASPERHELKLKLLEIYAETDETEKFNLQADELYAAVSGDESHVLWKQAIIFAAAIGSVSPLFAVDQTVINDSLEKVSLDEFPVSDNKGDGQQWLPDPVVDLDASDDFDAAILDDVNNIGRRASILPNNTSDELLGKTDESKSMISEPFISELEALLTDESSDAQGSSRTASNQDVELIDIDAEMADQDLLALSLAAIEDESKDAAKLNTTEISKTEFTDSDLGKVMSSFAEEAFGEGDIDQSSDADNQSTLKSKEVNSGVDSKIDSEVIHTDIFDGLDLLEESVAPEAEVDFSDNSLFLLSDEVGTKLDLARAYIEMGDHAGASDLLSEVLSEGDQRQKLEAKELMSQTAA